MRFHQGIHDFATAKRPLGIARRRPSSSGVMKLMEIVGGDGVNGAIVHCLLLTRELARRGHSVTVLCRPEAWIRRELLSDAVEIVESDLRRQPLDELRRVAGIVRDKQIELVHTHMTSAHVFGVLLRWVCGVPCIATAHAHNRQWHWMFNDRVISVSEATRRFHARHNLVSKHRIEVIHNFVDYNRFAAVAPEARVRMRASLKVDGSWPLIGFVGNTGNAKHTPSHLHFGINQNDEMVNPYPLLTRALPTQHARAHVELGGGFGTR